MRNSDVTALPEEYKRAVKKIRQGTLEEISYSCGNYINRFRQLVTNHNISAAKAGRETVFGDSIIKKCSVYLPSDYDCTDKEQRYDVLYLLHGVGGSSEEWLSGNGITDGNFTICNIFDNLIANGDINPMIVVFPEGRSAYDWTDTAFNPEGTNLLGFYYFDYELRYDLIPFIESRYNTYANILDTTSGGIAYNRLHRALAGLSMGGMQALNLGLGGYRCDSTVFTRGESSWKNGLITTVSAPGMLDLFAYTGTFSNAPTSSDGKYLGASIGSGSFKLHMLYMTCGDADGVAYGAGYSKAVKGLMEAAGINLGDYYRILIKDGIHDFNVWNNGAYNFSRLAFENMKEHNEPYHITKTLCV
ncbi:alpha/beta hydrolase [Anaerocolumna sp. MB42-C2]|uniref:alpha/beta hydrolase n=1 Tax=Anaerocolumna sp. MB42-C2 TaxID=3070997 RepID=UPI0027DFFB28|nr:alpha/beta hydrolase-fold protein [Anaerocolumna sp. MB42-C2]WMJ86564.1 alpha/beta hydrolase-fold protein [Anaerocolumna sp. MB42-C2]